MTTITRLAVGGGTTTPTFVTGYQAAYEAANVVHQLIDGTIAVTIVGQRPRSGTLHLYYTDETDAWDGVALHLGVSTFELEDADVAGVAMVYAAGTVSPVVRASDAELWLVDVDFQELSI